MSGAGDGRKRLSGFQYKQLREIKQQKLDEVFKKTPKIDSFLIPSTQKSPTSTVAQIGPTSTSSNAIQCDNNTESCCEVENENTATEPDLELTNTTNENVSGAGESTQLSITEDTNPGNDPYVGFDRNDPMTWNFTDENKEKQIDYLLSAPITQDLNTNFSKSARVYKKGDQLKFRHATKNMFFSELPNGEKTLRDWLLYSKSSGKVFCVPCKIFHDGKFCL